MTSELPPPGPTRVLCVDDIPDVVAVMKLIIQSEPSMECAGCLSSANDLVAEVRRREPRPDVVLLDGTMPGRDPMEAMKELREEFPSTRTVIYSGHNDPAFMQRARAAGAWACVSKAAHPQELIRVIQEVAAGRPEWPA